MSNPQRNVLTLHLNSDKALQMRGHITYVENGELRKKYSKLLVSLNIPDCDNYFSCFAISIFYDGTILELP